jgi:hypothetical protein
MQASRLGDLHEEDAAISLHQDATCHWQCAERQQEKCTVSAEVTT